MLLVKLGGAEVMWAATMLQSPREAEAPLTGFEGPARTPLNLPSTANA